MDMLKKARVKAMAAAKEIQTMVQAPQQQPSYQNSNYGGYPQSQAQYPYSQQQQPPPQPYSQNPQQPYFTPGQPQSPYVTQNPPFPPNQNHQQPYNPAPYGPVQVPQPFYSHGPYGSHQIAPLGPQQFNERPPVESQASYPAPTPQPYQTPNSGYPPSSYQSQSPSSVQSPQYPQPFQPPGHPIHPTTSPPPGQPFYQTTSPPAHIHSPHQYNSSPIPQGQQNYQGVPSYPNPHSQPQIPQSYSNSPAQSPPPQNAVPPAAPHQTQVAQSSEYHASIQEQYFPQVATPPPKSQSPNSVNNQTSNSEQRHPGTPSSLVNTSDPRMHHIDAQSSLSQSSQPLYQIEAQQGVGLYKHSQSQIVDQSGLSLSTSSRPAPSHSVAAQHDDHRQQAQISGSVQPPLQNSAQLTISTGQPPVQESFKLQSETVVSPYSQLTQVSSPQQTGSPSLGSSQTTYPMQQQEISSPSLITSGMKQSVPDHSQGLIPQHNSSPPISQYEKVAAPYSPPTLGLHREDSGLIAVLSEEPETKPSFHDVTPSPLKIRKRQTKCIGFEPVLTDIVEFFELTPVIVRTYNLPASTEGGCLAICEYCYYSIIAPHPWFANCFQQRAQGERPEDQRFPQISFDKLVGCGLAFPTIRQIVIAQTIPSNSIQPFIDYARLDATLAPCSGQPSTGGYYGTRAAEELALCRSCFECYVRGTSFERNFSLTYMPQPDQQWICDVGYEGYIQRTLVADIAKSPPDFSHFVSEAQKRLHMPACTGEGQPIALAGSNKSSCFRSVEDNRGVFCSSCFYDCIAGLPGWQRFGYEIELDDDNQKATLACDLTLGISKYFMGLAMKSGNFDVWHVPIMAKGQQPLCPSITGIDEADLMTKTPPQTWYSFIAHPEIEICPRCYGAYNTMSPYHDRTAGFWNSWSSFDFCKMANVACFFQGMNICSLQAEELFTPITRPLRAERIRMCYLSPVKEFSYSFDPMEYDNTTAWRGSYLRNAITYGRDAGGDFSLARQVAKHIACLPPACGSELRKFKKGSGRRFFGHQASDPNDLNDCTLMMCEECHAYSVKGTPLEFFLSNNLTHLTWTNPEGHRCSTWSKQCKRRLRTACETQDFASYAHWHHKREDVYNRLWAVMKEMEPMNAELKAHTARINQQTQLNIQMGGLRLQQQMNAQMNATIMGIGGSVAEAAASDSGYRYGNSTVGMGYLTAAGANAAQAQHNTANQPGIQFQTDWRNVPLEQLMAEMQKKLAIQAALKDEWVIMD